MLYPGLPGKWAREGEKTFMPRSVAEITEHKKRKTHILLNDCDKIFDYFDEIDIRTLISMSSCKYLVGFSAYIRHIY